MGRTKGARTVPRETCKAIYDMSRIGVKHVDIAEYYGIKKSTVSNILRRIRQNHNAITKKRGRKRKLSDRGMRLFQRYMFEGCFDPLFVIVGRFNQTTSLQISVGTARRYVKLLNLQSYVAVQKPFLSKKNIAARIIWARTHEHWTQKQWANVMFTDESSFTVRPKKNRMHVWRHRGQRLRTKFMVATFKSGYKTVSVWGGFSLRGRTPLVGIIGSFDSNTYRVIIDNHILPFAYDVHGGTESFVLQEDNCGPHRAKSIATYLANEEVSRMKWPAQSPDLNCIENVWGLLKSQLRKRKVYPNTPLQLFHILSNLWNSLPDSYFCNLVASMPRRIEMVRKNRGGATKY